MNSEAWNQIYNINTKLAEIQDQLDELIKYIDIISGRE